MTVAEIQAMREVFEPEDTKPMKKETRKEKRAREKDEKLAVALRDYGWLSDRLNAVAKCRDQAAKRAKALLVPGRIVRVAGCQYWVTEHGGLRRAERAENLDPPPPLVCCKLQAEHLGERLLTRGEWLYEEWKARQ